MTGLTILIPIALATGLVGLAAFLWAVRDGQYEDLDGAAIRLALRYGADGPIRTACRARCRPPPD